jgi:Rrf2 family transcriptional regulator, iron-sulfur cluster assembly transcription factor
MFTKACEYGIRSTIFIALKTQRNERCGLHDIATEIDSPEAYTAKILQLLVHNGIIESSKGPGGGYQMGKVAAERVSLAQIVEAYEGDWLDRRCGMGLTDCNEDHPCPIHHQFKNIRENLRNMLQNATIHHLANELDQGNSFLRAVRNRE